MNLAFKPITEKEFRAKGYNEVYDSLEDCNEQLEQEHRTSIASAQGLCVSYIADLAAVGNDREAVDQIRAKIREDELFWKHSRHIEQLCEGNMHWHYSVIRSEARRAARSAQEHWEEKQRQREAERKAILAAEKSEMENLSHFGMF